MATIQGLTKDRILQIEDATIVSAAFDTNAHLILTKHDGSTIDGGSIQTEGATNLRQIVKNQTGSTITKGTAVYISGATGNNALISKASAAAESSSSKTLGLLAEDILNGGFGEVMTEGLLEGIDTSAATAGDPVWLSTTAGSYVFGLANKPVAPAHLVYLGVVIRVQSQNGAIYIKPQNGFELEELHNVSIVSVNDNNILSWDTASQMWINQSAGALGVATTSALATTNANVTTAQAAADAAQATADGLATTKANLASPTFTGVVTAPNIASTIQYNYLPSPPTKTATVTLTATELLGDIIVSAGTATASLTLPTGALMDSGITNIPDGYAFTWSVINTVAFAKTMAPAASGHTYVGNVTIAVNASAQFLSRKNATGSWTTYRIS